MELVYLWIWDYKNIQKQGFNFSSRFECKFYDEYEEYKLSDDIIIPRLKDNCKLLIKNRNDYIPNFFGKNINVTAIVGENGSGKSSILDYIIRNLYFYCYADDGNTESNFKNIFIFYSYKDNKLYYIWNLPQNIKICNQSRVLDDKNILEKRWKPFKQNSKLEEQDEFDSLYYENVKLKIKNNYIIHFDYSSSHFLINDKTSGSTSRNTNVSKLYKSYLDNIICVPEKLVNNSNNNITICKENDKFKIIRFLIKNKRRYKYFNPNIVELISEKIILDKENIDCFKIFKEVIKIAKKQEKVNSKFTEKENIIQKYEDIFRGYDKKVINTLFTYDTGNSYSTGEVSYILKVNINKLNENNIKLITELPKNLFHIDLIESKQIYHKTFGKRYEDLSNGEKTALRIIYYIEDKISSNKIEYLILLDEPSNDMHPDWQKKLLNDLITTFENRKEKFHFIFTTHSPFMISDLPKDNIIFLKDGKQDKGIRHKQTFGANIHTLLSDSFFMEDGLMGEFAKSKINNIKKLYQLIQNENVQERLKEETTKELAQKSFNRRKKRLWQIQKIIGEPFLQTVIKNYLDEIENILFEDKAKKIAIERFIKEFGKDTISEVMNSAKN